MDRKWGFFIVFFLLFTNLTVAVTNANAATWSTIPLSNQRKDVSLKSSRSIAIGKSGYPLIVYGGNGLYYAYYDGSAWHYETVESLLNVDYYPSIAVDKSGAVHIGYYESGNLMYATNVSGTWTTESVDGTGYVDVDTISTAVDSSGDVHIVYYDESNDVGKIKYATNASGQWITETAVSSGTETVVTGGGSFVDTEFTVSSPLMALDSSGKVHIIYDKSNTPYIMYSNNTSGTWTSEKIIVSGNPSSIAVDSSNKVHILYHIGDDYSYSLKYATNTSGTWTTDTVDSGNNGSSSIAIDSSGKVHISYLVSDMIKYATNTSGTWTTETVDSGDNDNSSITVDLFGKVHISYLTSSDMIKYATNTSGSWATETIDSGSNGTTIYDTSMAVDSSDNVHISYSANDGTKYVTNTSGTWTTEIIDEKGGYGVNISIAIDSSGKVCILNNNTNSEDKYITNVSGTWTTETIGYNKVGDSPSLAVDSSDNAHIISYYSSYPDQIRYTTNASGAWTTETIDSSSSSVEIDKTSMVIDSSDKIHVSYTLYKQDSQVTSLKYLTNISGTWTTELIKDGDSWQSLYSTIAVDSSNKVHLSYTDTGWYTAYVKYATNTSGTWTTETIYISETSLSYDTSISVDSSDKVHISYYVYSYEDLKYATNTSGKWAIETIGNIGGTGGYNSVALDRSDNVHISCYDSKNNCLRYFTTRDITGLKVTTGSATDVSSASADLIGTIVPNGTTTVWFEYGRSSGYYGKISPTQRVSGDDKTKVTITISGLSNDTTYYYRLAAQNSIGVTYGEEKSFTVGTPSQTPTVTPTPTSTCEVKTISLSEKKLTLQRNESREITVTLTGDNGCIAEGTKIKRKISSAGKKCVSVTASREADANGQAIFTVTAKNKTGNAKVTFTAGKVKKSLTVKVKK